jgi:hypothetical protein
MSRLVRLLHPVARLGDAAIAIAFYAAVIAAITRPRAAFDDRSSGN